MKHLLAFIICAFVQGCGGSPAPRITVELNGDSICSATGIPTTCAQLLPTDWVIDDRAIAGLTLHKLYTGYAEVWAGGPLGKNGIQQAFDKTPHPSQYIVISQGGNDAYEARDPAIYEAELRAILTHIRAIGKTPVVTGIVAFQPGPVFDAGTVSRAVVLNSIVHRVAAELGVIDAHWDTSPMTDTVDGIHRTAPTLRSLVQLLQKTIQP